jgi:hypothetical protein
MGAAVGGTAPQQVIAEQALALAAQNVDTQEAAKELYDRAEGDVRLLAGALRLIQTRLRDEAPGEPAGDLRRALRSLATAVARAKPEAGVRCWFCGAPGADVAVSAGGEPRWVCSDHLDPPEDTTRFP